MIDSTGQPQLTAITDDERLALAKKMLANTHEDWLIAHKGLTTQLLSAAAQYKLQGGDKLEAFTKVVAAFNRYAHATNAPADVCFMLSDMMGEFANLGEGRPSNVLKSQKTKISPRTPVQHEALWAAAAVYVDFHGGGLKAAARAEEKLRHGGCPLPRNSAHGTNVPGASITNWRKKKRNARKSGMLDQLFKAHRDAVDRLVRDTGMSPEKAAEMYLDAIIEKSAVVP